MDATVAVRVSNINAVFLFPQCKQQLDTNLSIVDECKLLIY